MPSMRTQAVLDHPAEEVWTVVRDIGAICEWFPAMTGSRTVPGGRVVILSDGSMLEEEIVTLDDDLRRLQYRIRGGDLPVKAHLGTVDVIELAQSRSLLVYGTDLEPAELAAAFDSAITEAVRGLGSFLAGRAVTPR